MRQKLFQEGRVSRYLLYALGEIVLVVIGILIALQLNNWNSEYQAGKEELKLLREMRDNLATDLEDCYWNIKKQQDLKNSNLAVLSHLENRTPFHDSLSYHYGNLIYSTTQKRNMATYDHLKSRGIDLVRNDSLRRNITTVYSERYYFIEKMELEYDNPYQLNQVVPQLNSKLILNQEEKTGKPVNLKMLQDDEIFKGAIRMNADIRAVMIKRYGRLSSDIQALIDQLDEELKLRK
jgi:hypothetical protein